MVSKDEYLIAVHPKKPDSIPVAGTSGSAADFAPDKDLSDSFKSLAWSQNINALGKLSVLFFFENELNLFVSNAVWDEPYAVALTKGSIEIRVLKASESDKDTLIQTIPGLKDARFLLRSKQHYILAASSKTLWYIQAVDIPTQRRHLLQSKKFHLALQLTVSHRHYISR